MQNNIGQKQQHIHRIILKPESCDNLLKQSIEFLHLIKNIKQSKRLNIQVIVDDIREPCYINGNTVIWGYANIIKHFMALNTKQGAQVNGVASRQQFGNSTNKSPYSTNDAMGDTVSQLDTDANQLQNYQLKLLNEGDDDHQDRSNSNPQSNKVNTKMNTNQQSRQSQSREQEIAKQQPISNKSQAQRANPVQVSQVSIDDDYHSRFLDELKSGGD